MVFLRALISLYDKAGLVEFASGLVELGVEILSSGGTSAKLAEAGIPHVSTDELTGFTEMLSGRVKTLHPAIHAGILADRSKPEHLADLADAEIGQIDIVVVNLYPFTSDPSVELIDVGGPTMIRAAAKNHFSVASVVDPLDYPLVLDEIRDFGEVRASTRRSLAYKAFRVVSDYDSAIASWLATEEPVPGYPIRLNVGLNKIRDLRYGENPHQSGALYSAGASVWSGAEWISGLQPSYLNIFDADAAWRLLWDLPKGRPACVIVKHANPCGVAIADTVVDAYQAAFDCDPISAFGGIVALSHTVDLALATTIAGRPKADVIVAPGFDQDAVDLLASKRKNTRLLRLGMTSAPELQIRSLTDAYLVQSQDQIDSPDSWQLVAGEKADQGMMDDLVMAWTTCARTTSNSIVIVKSNRAVGVGAGQQNRVDSAKIAASKAAALAMGAAAASDAFFPFPDGLETLSQAGVRAVVAPSGSIRDQEIIEVAEALGITLYFTTSRHFRH
ncbi:MAG: bifunctional phosphoribosylaminoimidazolecarboxamide formyltransferase/IMP cyclohydrolase [Acidimicrobiaceae bacterium]|nr:bifunctional phosphoribosylaminoimidazolecarboxamide formyltransferase/IMP cyclohydrolase [Acidimicrobiaceae bacterium]